jgi:predicted DNA-binding transcriptional regulator YafY
MRRADRLLQIIQILRRSNGPTTAQAIADELEVVPRTIYRGIKGELGDASLYLHPL